MAYDNAPGSGFGPIEMVVLQGTSYCNLNCSYCYLSEESRRHSGTMTLATIQRAFEEITSSPFTGSRLRVSWHSGEPLVLKPDYYRAAIETVLNVRDGSPRPDLVIDFDFQTNATLINAAWIEFFKEYEGLVTLGVSCDGPAELHDRHRKNWSGRSSHAATERGMQALSEAGIPFDVTAVISPDGLDEPELFLAYFEPFVPFIREFHFNLHDELFIDTRDRAGASSYVMRYKAFLSRLLDLIASGNYKTPKIRNFASFYNRLFVPAAERPSYDARSMSAPFKTVSIEMNGDLTTFYAGLTLDECGDQNNLYGDGRGLVIGNILESSLSEMAGSEKLKLMMHDFETSHSACESSCDYFDVCSGGYNLIKLRRHGSFGATETPECLVHVKAFADAVLEHMSGSLQAAG